MRDFLDRYRNRRKIRIYGVGTGKSGTHTLAGMWADNIKTAHEPESEFLLGLYLKWKSGELSNRDLSKLLIEQDRRLDVEVNSSAVNYLFFDLFREVFPRSKFILTIRNPYSWLDSIFNHSLTHACSPNWLKLRELRFRPDLYVHSKEEHVLESKGLYTLDGYLSYWNEHNSKVISGIPSKRLLVVRTDKISQSVDEIAWFSGLKNTGLMNKNLHAFPAQNKYNLLNQLDPDYIDSKVDFHCHSLLKTYFPDISSVKDIIH